MTEKNAPHSQVDDTSAFAKAKARACAVVVDAVRRENPELSFAQAGNELRPNILRSLVGRREGPTGSRQRAIPQVFRLAVKGAYFGVQVSRLSDRDGIKPANAV
jgi:hypothetical protein